MASAVRIGTSGWASTPEHSTYHDHPVQLPDKGDLSRVCLLGSARVVPGHDCVVDGHILLLVSHGFDLLALPVRRRGWGMVLDGHDAGPGGLGCRW